MPKKELYILTFFLLFSLETNSQETNEYVSTSSGKVQGYLENKVINYDDIPYAKPPIGDLRWKAPREILNVDGVIKNQDNNFCIQEPSSMGGAPGEGILTGSEDCLYLDIKTPKKKSSELLPVMFWIHGGGNTSGLKDLYDYSTMVNRHDVIVVTINYRLGAFGWFTHPSIQGNQEGLDKASNFGTLDIIQALKWVNENIELFGGDSNNITIFGESAGGHNVLSLMVAPQAKGLFQKAISQSGYTTSTSIQRAFAIEESHPTYDHTSNEVVKRLIDNHEDLSSGDIYKKLLELSAEEFFSEYSDKSNLEVPLLTNDGIVIPLEGLEKALSNSRYVSDVPFMAGSNRDEVKLWIGTAEYFVKLDYSFFGSILGIPRVTLKDEDAFEAFNYYRSQAWKVRGVIEPISSLNKVGSKNTYAYKFDWDDHRRFIVADFKKLIGASHGTEISLITGNNKLVEGYGFLIYPAGPSKRFISKNMMLFWSNFAKDGKPGPSTNGINWDSYNHSEGDKNFMILDNKKNMKIVNLDTSYKSLVEELNLDTRVSELERCVILYQMGTFVGNDILDEISKYADFSCKREDSRKFLEENASFISY
ncbi:carboxylesterase family protein [Gammaproteobacteria bacterium]|nr:carboxylesterase family protein [Gammaproteobacteria bacterium]MDA8957358.1 carboxylesterase family protein [Gammaproteobacteria bacterium]MDA9011054.1 carboxylesterase family protein [Gammaproteobacteria bacterium]MDA9118483.1 carboxylesterase family protein [Gammaproteobacteria bacterium]MDA9196439.1 carboxylesterase family protein [Gammaproteobacteria bacterium]